MPIRGGIADGEGVVEVAAPGGELEKGPGVRLEGLNNNATLAYLGLGDTSTAATLESKALAAGPEDPVFLMTAGSGLEAVTAALTGEPWLPLPAV